MKLETLNVFLDTSIFESNNFLHGKKLNSLFKHAEEETIRIYSSEIAIQELKERVRKKISVAKKDIKDFRKIKSVEIFRNSEVYENFETIWNINYERQIELICKSIDSLVTNLPIELLSVHGVNIDDIFNLYFNNAPPFKEGEKKFEFPDAFILASIDSWCKISGQKMNVISSDKDWINYESEYLIIFSSLDDLLSQITLHKEVATLERVDFVIKKCVENNKKLEKELFTALGDHGIYDSDFGEIENIEISDIKIGEYTIIEIDDENAEVTAEIEFQVKYEISYQDFDNGFYDKEDDEWYFVETREFEATTEITIPITLTTTYNINGNQFEAELDIINDEELIDLINDRDDYY